MPPSGESACSAGQKKFHRDLHLTSFTEASLNTHRQAIADWFGSQEWSPGEKGVWEKLQTLTSLHEVLREEQNPDVLLRALPLLGLTDDYFIPESHWPFPIQYPLEKINSLGSPQLQHYVTLYEAMIHLHFVAAASQYFWAVEDALNESPALQEEDDIRCGILTIFEGLTDKCCMGGKVWMDRAGLITLASRRLRPRLPFPEIADLLEPDRLALKIVISPQGQAAYLLIKGGAVLKLLQLAASVRNKLHGHGEALSDQALQEYTPGLATLLDLLGLAFRPYHGKQMAIVHEKVLAGQVHQGILYSWDGTDLKSCLNELGKRRLRQVWTQPPPPDLDLFPAPPPPQAGLRWDESLILFDPQDPYRRSLYLMPFGFRFRHRLAPEDAQQEGRHILPGLVDSVRWYRDKAGVRERVKAIVQRTYAGLGPKIRQLSDEIPDDEGARRPDQLEFIEKVALRIRDLYQLEIPTKAYVQLAVRPHFDLEHGREALRLAKSTVLRPQELERLERELLSSPSRRLVVQGASGSGKTCIVAQLYQRRQSQAVFLSFDCAIRALEDVHQDAPAGPMPEEREKRLQPTEAVAIRMHFLSGLCQRLGIEPPLAIQASGEACQSIRSLLAQEPSQQLLIIVDGLNQCGDPEGVLSFLPDPLPENLYLLVTTQPVPSVWREISRYGRRSWNQVDLNPLTPEESSGIIDFYWNPPGAAEQLPPLDQELADMLLAVSHGIPIFLSEWTQEARRLYLEYPQDFAPKVRQLLDPKKGRGLPPALRERFTEVMAGFSPPRFRPGPGHDPEPHPPSSDRQRGAPRPGGAAGAPPARGHPAAALLPGRSGDLAGAAGRLPPHRRNGGGAGLPLLARNHRPLVPQAGGPGAGHPPGAPGPGPPGLPPAHPPVHPG